MQHGVLDKPIVRAPSVPSDQPAPKRTRFDKLMGVFERYYASLSELNDARAGAAAVEGWESYKRQVLGALATKKVSKSMIAAGLEQGLRELRELPPGVKQLGPAPSALERAIALEYPEFLHEDEERLSMVLKRGRIRTERDYYLVRHAIDQEEGKPSDRLAELYRLADNFDAG
jgi:hypothetical protein